MRGSFLEPSSEERSSATYYASLVGSTNPPYSYTWGYSPLSLYNGIYDYHGKRQYANYTISKKNSRGKFEQMLKRMQVNDVIHLKSAVQQLPAATGSYPNTHGCPEDYEVHGCKNTDQWGLMAPYDDIEPLKSSYYHVDGWTPSTGEMGTYASQCSSGKHYPFQIFSYEAACEFSQRYEREFIRRFEKFRPDTTLFMINLKDLPKQFASFWKMSQKLRIKSTGTRRSLAHAMYIAGKVSARNARKSKCKAASEAWVAYWHAWRHFFRDAKGVYAVLTDIKSVLDEMYAAIYKTETVRFGAHANNTLTSDKPWCLFNQAPGGACRSYMDCQWSERINFTATMQIVPNEAFYESSTLFQILSTTGALPTWHTLWDLTHYTYVLDWFFSRYQLLNKLSLDKIGKVELPMTIKLTNICVSQKIRWEKRFGATWRCSCADSVGASTRDEGSLYIRRQISQAELELFVSQLPIRVRPLGLIPSSLALALVISRR